MPPRSPWKQWRARIDREGVAVAETVEWIGPGNHWRWTKVFTAWLPDADLQQLADAIEESGVWQLDGKYRASYSNGVRGSAYTHTQVRSIAVGRGNERHRVVVDGMGPILRTAEREFQHPHLPEVERFQRLFELTRQAIPVPAEATDAGPDLLRIAVGAGDTDVAYEAIDTLGMFEVAGAIPVLEMLTASEHPQIARRATRSLRWLRR